MQGLFLALCALLTVVTGRVVITAEGQDTPHLLGAKACTWGPSYWCQNITTAAGCKATKHCISKVWEKLHLPEDTDSVCGICKDMVQQARDQLESNQTQSDLKAVFEGSCALIHVKPIVQECDRLVDQFIPELVETLASQMNPSVVCSVAGLCNSPRIDQMLHEYEMQENGKMKTKDMSRDEADPDDCSKCYTVATHMEYKLNKTSRDHILEEMLGVCGQMGSFSDACSSILLTHFNVIHSHLVNNFRAENICHLSGQCSSKFHVHKEAKPLDVEIRPLSSVGMVEIGDELPCKLCEQLVGHLRDLLVANTTEAEFQQVLKGLCKQTKSFSTECMAIVDQYYPEIYAFLTQNLNSNAICQMAGLCPAPGKAVFKGPIWPLVPEKAVKIGVRLLNGKKQEESKQELKTSEIEEMQLPIERLGTSGMFGSRIEVKGKESCAFCEYLMHYVQQAITSPATSDELKQLLDGVCRKLPKSVESTCEEFVSVYGDAAVAILAQEIDPSVVCPMMHVCPTQEMLEILESIPPQALLKKDVEEKPSCPLCLLAVTQLYNVIKNNKTEANIEDQLQKLCTHLPKDLNEECQSFVDGYSHELIAMLLADLSPQEVCVYIKLCNPQKNVGLTSFYPMDKDGEIISNEIPNFPLHPSKPTKTIIDDAECAVCEFAMQYIEKALKNKNTKDEVEKIVHGVCNYMPSTLSHDCNKFVNKYADLVISLLANEVSPKEICTVIGACLVEDEKMERMEASVAECALCQTIVSTLEKALGNPKVDAEIEEIVSKVCKYLPASQQNKCTMMMEVYEQSIINIIRSHGDTKKICSKIALCSASDYLAMSASKSRVRRAYDESNLGNKPCTWGESYWCSSENAAAKCKATKHCKEKVWMAESAEPAKSAAKAASAVQA